METRSGIIAETLQGFGGRRSDKGRKGGTQEHSSSLRIETEFRQKRPGIHLWHPHEQVLELLTLWSIALCAQ